MVCVEGEDGWRGEEVKVFGVVFVGKKKGRRLESGFERKEE